MANIICLMGNKVQPMRVRGVDYAGQRKNPRIETKRSTQNMPKYGKIRKKKLVGKKRMQKEKYRNEPRFNH